MIALRFTPLALADVARLRETIEATHPDGLTAGIRLADTALASLWAALERLRQFPGLGRRSPLPGVQELVVPGPTRHLTLIVGYRAAPGQVVVLGITWGGRRFTS